jgi:N-acyl-D-amino-acid deacylase
VLNHRYSSLQNVEDLMRHPAALFMTDATPYTEGGQNPGSFGCFPRFLQLARDYNLMSLEETVQKMTGANAERFRVPRRGLLRDGYYADVTVFDWRTVRDNNEGATTDAAPTGIEAVFINGRQVLDKGKVDGAVLAGMVV